MTIYSLHINLEKSRHINNSLLLTANGRREGMKVGISVESCLDILIFKTWSLTAVFVRLMMIMMMVCGEKKKSVRWDAHNIFSLFTISSFFFIWKIADVMFFWMNVIIQAFPLPSFIYFFTYFHPHILH